MTDESITKSLTDIHIGSADLTPELIDSVIKQHWEAYSRPSRCRPLDPMEIWFKQRYAHLFVQRYEDPKLDYQQVLKTHLRSDNPYKIGIDAAERAGFFFSQGEQRG